MVDVCVVTNIFRCNADLCESPRTQEGVFGESVISAGSVYTLPARIFFFPMGEKTGGASGDRRVFFPKLVERENKLPLANVLDVLDVVSRYHSTRGSHSP